MKVFNPGIQYYADRIKDGIPFSFTKLGDGEMQRVIPGTRQPNLSLQHPQFWTGKDEFLEILTHAWQDENYIVAFFHLYTFKKYGSFNYVNEWITHNMPALHWHDATVWEKALIDGTLYPIVKAIREQPLPLILVGPKCIANIGKLAQWDIKQHIITHNSEAWRDRHSIVKQIADVREPAFFALSTGSVTKLIIYRAWPWIGHQSFLIDFGSTWNAFTEPCRRFQHRLSQETLDKCLGVKTANPAPPATDETLAAQSVSTTPAPAKKSNLLAMWRSITNLQSIRGR